MKKLHTLCANDTLRPVMQYLEISNGYVYGTDAHILAKIPQSEVFGTEFFPKDAKFYIEGKQWKAQKMYAAHSFVPQVNFEKGGLIMALDKKGQTLGICQFFTQSEFEAKVGRYPDCERVLYSSDVMPENITQIGFNPDLFARLTEALEDKMKTFKLSFFGQRRAILVEHTNPDEYTNGIGVIMPIMIG